VKIGPPFTTGCPGELDACAIVRAAVEVSRALGKRVIAERVETAAMAGALRRMGVEYAQGHLFGDASTPCLDAAAADAPPRQGGRLSASA